MDEEWRRWHPTPRLRWVLPPFTVASGRNYPRLQQEWQHEETGRMVWRVVPTDIVPAEQMDGDAVNESVSRTEDV